MNRRGEGTEGRFERAKEGERRAGGHITGPYLIDVHMAIGGLAVPIHPEGQQQRHRQHGDGEQGVDQHVEQGGRGGLDICHRADTPVGYTSTDSDGPNELHSTAQHRTRPTTARAAM